MPHTLTSAQPIQANVVVIGAGPAGSAAVPVAPVIGSGAPKSAFAKAAGPSAGDSEDQSTGAPRHAWLLICCDGQVDLTFGQNFIQRIKECILA